MHMNMLRPMTSQSLHGRIPEILIRKWAFTCHCGCWKVGFDRLKWQSFIKTVDFFCYIHPVFSWHLQACPRSFRHRNVYCHSKNTKITCLVNISGSTIAKSTHYFSCSTFYEMLVNSESLHKRITPSVELSVPKIISGSANSQNTSIFFFMKSLWTLYRRITLCSICLASRDTTQHPNMPQGSTMYLHTPDSESFNCLKDRNGRLFL